MPRIGDYKPPEDPTSGHHLERNNECGLGSPNCLGQLRNNQGSYRQKVTTDGKIVSMCEPCFQFILEQVGNK